MKNIRVFYLKILEVKFSIYLNRRVFVMCNMGLVLFEKKKMVLNLAFVFSKSSEPKSDQFKWPTYTWYIPPF